MDRNNGSYLAIGAAAALAAVALIRQRKGGLNENEDTAEADEPLRVAARAPERALSAMGQEKMPPKKWRELMASRGVTAEQMALRGFDDLEQAAQAQGKKSLTRSEVLDWFQKRPVALKEIWRGLPPESSVSPEERALLEKRKKLQAAIRKALTGMATGPEIDTAIGGGMMNFPSAMIFTGSKVEGPEIIKQKDGNVLAYSYETVAGGGKWGVYFNGQPYTSTLPTRLGDIKMVKGKPVWASVSWRDLLVNGKEYTIEGGIEPVVIPNSNGRTADQFYSSSLAVSPDGKLVAIGTNLYDIYFWSVKDEKVIAKFNNNEGLLGFNITALAWGNSGLFFADQAGRVRLLDVNGKGKAKVVKTLREGLYAFMDKLNPMEVDQSRKQEAFESDTAAVEALVLSPDEKTLAAVSAADGITLYNTSDMSEIVTAGRGKGLISGSWLERNDRFMAMGDRELAEIGTDGSFFSASSEALDGGRGVAMASYQGLLASCDVKTIRLIRIEEGTKLYSMIKEYLSIPHKESDAKWASYVVGQPDAYREMLLQYKPEQLIQGPVAHWPEYNPFGWARMTWRKPGSGSGHVLFVDEIQSDWAQRARKNPSGYGKFPMPNDWWAAIFKHALVEAIRTGAKSIALTDAETIGVKVGNNNWQKQLAPFYDVQISNWMKKFGQSLGIDVKQISIPGLTHASYWGFDLTPENVNKIKRAGLSLFGRV